ncbi:hypothetical protein BJ546DRAFT_838594 [Cryomyces antarcticus]
MILHQSIFRGQCILSDPAKEAIIASLWKTHPIRPITIATFDSYFNYYQVQCHASHEAKHAAATHRDILDIVDHISRHSDQSKEMLQASLQIAHPRLGTLPDKLGNSIELAVRLWLMIEIRTSAPGPEEYLSLQPAIPWPERYSVAELVRHHFTTSPPAYVTGKMRFSKLLNARNLTKIGGFQLLWTDNLLDHLAIKEEKGICVYFHAAVMQQIRASESDILPKDFLDETMQTIALLLPSADLGCASWLRQVLKGGDLDPQIRGLKTASRDISSYKYWRDRLLILEESFDQSEPGNISQWWHDRRKKVQWYTFWVAILVLVLTIVFGLIQSVTGILQVWAAVKGLH